jgi:hypothetical protein
VDTNQKWDEEFNRALAGHLESQLAQSGTHILNSQQHGMILSALKGMWDYAYKKGQEDMASPVVAPGEPQVVRYMWPIAVTESQAAVCRRSELYKLGDAVLVWVNEGDLSRCGQKLPAPASRKTEP